MSTQKIEHLLEQIRKLNPSEKGELFSLFLLQEKRQMKGNRRELFASIKVDHELTDEEIKSSLYNLDINNILEK